MRNSDTLPVTITVPDDRFDQTGSLKMLGIGLGQPRYHSLLLSTFSPFLSDTESRAKHALHEIKQVDPPTEDFTQQSVASFLAKLDHYCKSQTICNKKLVRERVYWNPATKAAIQVFTLGDSPLRILVYSADGSFNPTSSVASLWAPGYSHMLTTKHGLLRAPLFTQTVNEWEKGATKALALLHAVWVTNPTTDELAWAIHSRSSKI
jgi:hypothetical protein